MLHVAAQHDVAGMADREQDAGVREQPADRRQGEHVQRILVDQALAGRQLELAPDALPVSAAQLVELRATQVRQLAADS